MSNWLPIIAVAVIGFIGGVINSWVAGDNDAFAHTKHGITRHGFLINGAIGAFAAFIFWALYGPWAAYPVFGGTVAVAGLTWTEFASSGLVGFGGSRWLTSEVDKRFLSKAASVAAGKTADQTAAAEMALAKPAEALNIAMRMR